MRLIVCILLLALAGCASTEYQPYEGLNNEYQGQGGSKVVVDGVDIWTNGTPPHRYKLLGITTVEVGDGWRAESVTRSSVATEVKAQNGDAAVLLDSTSQFSGIYQTPNGYGGSTAYAIHKRMSKYAVIKYLDKVSIENK